MNKSESPVLYFIITLFLGTLGVHHFMTGKIGMGLLYLVTGGLFGIGWIIDCVSSFIAMVQSFSSGRNYTESTYTEETHRTSMDHCRRCGREMPFSSSTLCTRCKEELKREYVEVSEHFATVIDEVEGNLLHLEDYLVRFDTLSKDIDKMWDMSRDLDVVPPFQRTDLQKAMNKKFTDAVNSRISMSMEKARITLDQAKLKDELTHLTEELIECKYHHTRYSDLINQVIDRTKEVIATL